MQHAADAVTFVVVERLLVNTSDGAAAVEHQVFADQAAGVRKTIRKLLVRGKQEQAGRFSPVRANRYGLCPLQMRVALFIKIDCADGAPVGVQFDPMHVGIRANLATAGLLRDRNHGRKGAGLCFDFTAEAEAEATVNTGASPGARLRKNGHRRWKRVKTEFARGPFEQDTV